MNEEPDRTKEPEAAPTPDVDRLLKMLEVQSTFQRQRRAPSTMQSPGFRYGVLIAIVIFAFGSLGVLEWILSQLQRPAHPPVPKTPTAAVDNLHK